jgi:AhpD family alkylhydroperoxidase
MLLDGAQRVRPVATLMTAWRGRPSGAANRQETTESEMRQLSQTITVLAAMLLAATSAYGQEAGSQAAYRDIEQTLGSVPSFFKAFPEAGIAGAWGEFKSVQLNPNTALSGKMKELIGLAVAAQVPCSYCIYFHTAAAKLNGASDEEIREAVAMAAITRHWSTVLNGMQIDPATFRAETDAVLRLAGERAKTAASNKAQ